MRSQTFDLLTPQPFGRDPTLAPFDDVFSDDFSVQFMDTSGMRSQMFDLLSPQPFGRDRTCDVISFDEIDFRQCH